MELKITRMLVVLVAGIAVGGCAANPEKLVVPPKPQDPGVRTLEAISRDYEQMGNVEKAREFDRLANERKIDLFAMSCTVAGVVFNLVIRDQIGPFNCER